MRKRKKDTLNVIINTIIIKNVAVDMYALPA